MLKKVLKGKGSLQKQKKFNKCYIGGGLTGQNVTLTKVVFKIHNEKWGGTPILSHFLQILAIIKIFTSVLTFLGGKKFFFAKVPQKWSSFLKKIHCIFVTLGGEGGRSYAM